MNENDILREKYIDLDKKIRPLIKEKNLQLSNNNDKLTYPLFLRDTDGYHEADPRLMIFGQETNSWCDKEKKDCIYGERDDTDVDMIIDRYKIFFNDGNPKCRSNFWPIVKQFMRTFSKKIKNRYDEEYSWNDFYLWNNLVKVGKKGKGFPDKWYNDIIKPHFNNLVLMEIEILEPHFIIFFTGSTREYREVLDDIFNDPEKPDIDGFANEDLCEVKIPNVIKAFRTHHPQRLCRENKERPYKEYINKIIEEIKKC